MKRAIINLLVCSAVDQNLVETREITIQNIFSINFWAWNQLRTILGCLGNVYTNPRSLYRKIVRDIQISRNWSRNLQPPLLSQQSVKFGRVYFPATMGITWRQWLFRVGKPSKEVLSKQRKHAADLEGVTRHRIRRSQNLKIHCLGTIFRGALCSRDREVGLYGTKFLLTRSFS